MKICRYVVRDAASGSASPRYGLIEGENVIEISGAPWGPWSRGSRSTRLDDVQLLAPAEPTKIVCIGRNYAAHTTALRCELVEDLSCSVYGPLDFPHDDADARRHHRHWYARRSRSAGCW